MDLVSLNYNESLVIKVKGQEVKITLLPSKDNHDEYAFGIKAPRNITIDREEVREKKKG